MLAGAFENRPAALTNVDGCWVAADAAGCWAAEETVEGVMKGRNPKEEDWGPAEVEEEGAALVKVN